MVLEAVYGAFVAVPLGWPFLITVLIAAVLGWYLASSRTGEC